MRPTWHLLKESNPYDIKLTILIINLDVMNELFFFSPYFFLLFFKQMIRCVVYVIDYVGDIARLTVCLLLIFFCKFPIEMINGFNIVNKISYRYYMQARYKECEKERDDKWQ